MWDKELLIVLIIGVKKCGVISINICLKIKKWSATEINKQPAINNNCDKKDTLQIIIRIIMINDNNII